MKSYLLLLLLWVGPILYGHARKSTTFEKGTSELPQKVQKKIIKKGFVSYQDFQVPADGKTDALPAIVQAHAFANMHKLPVKLTTATTYYIGGKNLTAIIETDTDFGKARFLIDDSAVTNKDAAIFQVKSSYKVIPLNGITSLKRNQATLDITLSSPALITATDTSVRHYIRFGPNQNKGSIQTDLFLVDTNGNIDPKTPIIWDFKQLTSLVALPIDTTPLTIKGGHFTTIANRAPSKYTYYARNLLIKRSHVTIDGLVHEITGEGDHGAPYNGFISIAECVNVTVQNTTLTGHKTYQTIGAAGTTVSMGSYDISVNRALNVTFRNCKQTNDINDPTYWGIMGSNFCKNIAYDGCTFSRFDAHQGVANATIRNSTLGHMGINAIGTGLLTIENSTIKGRTIVNLRSDYGSTWEGNVVIRNCTFIPFNGRKIQPILIGGYNNGQHDFGYTCYMPARILIENLTIEDTNTPDGYKGAYLFSNFNPKPDQFQPYPYQLTKEVVLKNIITSSKRPLLVSENPDLFKDLRIKHDN